MKVKITFNTDNADVHVHEVFQAIEFHIAKSVGFNEEEEGTILDSNGNKIGQWEVTNG